MKTLENPTSINPPSSSSFFFFFFTLFLFVEHCFCLDPRYEACVPKDCGDVFNISYPFFIKGVQNSFCGYPGFELNCSNNGVGAPILRISGSDFIVRHISYETSSLRLLNAVIWPNTTRSCPSAIRNITVTPNQFEIDNSSTKNIVFLPNCSQLPPNLERYKIQSCQSGRELVMLENDENLPKETEFCNRDSGVVEAPVEFRSEDGMSEVVDGGNYVEVMRRGFLMRWFAADCTLCKRSGGRCGLNTTASQFQFSCFCPDRPHRVSCKPARRKHKPVIIGVVAGSVLLVAVATAVFMIRVARKHKFLSYFSTRDKSRDVEDGSVYFGVPVFSYTELEDATRNFDASQELGDGGFGTVYYGKLRDGREVAVKRLYEHNYKRVQQFMNEVEILTRLRHQNLVSLYGCTSHRSRELLLVYEYIPNGTVADHLHGDGAKVSPLTWPIRMKIAIETASALVYLHASEIIHRDVKTNNILLDHNFCVKVADFGLSRLLPNDVTHVSTAPQGTPGYVDPEYHQCYQLTDKSDVYSFGVVLIELISSMPAIDITRSRDEISLANMAINRIQRCALDELIDPLLGSDPETERMTTSVAELAFRCLQFDSESRPTMNEVLEVLKGIEREQNTEDVDNVGELQNVKQQLPPPSPESENVGLLKDLTTSPISVTVKWHSTSSGSITPSTSVRD